MADAPDPDPQPAVWMPEGADPASAEAQSILGAEAAREWLDAEPRSVGDAMGEIQEAGGHYTRAAVRGDWGSASWWGGYRGQISAAVTEALGR